MTTSQRVLVLPDRQALADLAVFVGRAKRLDDDGAARLVAHGDVLAVYACALHGGGGPTVLGLRAMRLAAPSHVDVTVSLAALTDRFARGDTELAVVEEGPGGVAELAVPPTPATNAAWAGVSPPRSGWEPSGLVDPAALRRAAREGIEEVAAGAPAGAGSAAVARLRASVWGRQLPSVEGLPAGVAFAATAFGFLAAADGDVEEPATLLRHGPWTRLSTVRGHILARRALIG